MKINIKDITPEYTPTNPEYNTIKIRTEYQKGLGLIAYLQEGEYKSEGMDSFSYDLFNSKKLRKNILPLKRKNQKLIIEAEKTFYDNESYMELIPQMTDSF